MFGGGGLPPMQQILGPITGNPVSTGAGQYQPGQPLGQHAGSFGGGVGGGSGAPGGPGGAPGGAPAQDFNLLAQALFPFLPPDLQAILAGFWDEHGDVNVALALMRQHALYEQYFPGNYVNGIIAMTEAEYVAYREGVTVMMERAGIPAGFYDSVQDVGEYVANNVSLDEIAWRVENGFLAAMQGDPQIIEEWSRLRGRPPTPGELAAFWLDPERARSVIVREFAQAQLSTIGIQTGFGRLDLNEAERLLDVGVQPGEQARSGLAQAAALQPISGRALGTQSGRTFSRGQLLEALFEEDVELTRALTLRRNSRLNQFRGGGSAAESSTGFTAFTTN